MRITGMIENMEKVTPHTPLDMSGYLERRYMVTPLVQPKPS